MCNMDKMVEKISNLLDLANNNPNENEALAAALKAQELMAKYHIELADLSHDSGTKISEELCSTDGSGSLKWQDILANVIADNFCCKTYRTEKGNNIGVRRKYTVFYGYEHDAKIAKEVFMFLYNAGIKLAKKEYNDARKAGKHTKYVTNTYLMGFCTGIKEMLGKQCTALMVVTPKEVEDGFAEMSKSFRSRRIVMKRTNDSDLYERGVRDGKDTVNSRSIEKAS